MWTAKQKIVLKIDMACDKCKTNAKGMIATTKGVSSLSIEGDDRAVVIGEGIDAANLVVSIRKRIKREVHVLSIEEMKSEKGKVDKKKNGEGEKQKGEENKKNVGFWPEYPYYGYNYVMYPTLPCSSIFPIN